MILNLTFDIIIFIEKKKKNIDTIEDIFFLRIVEEEERFEL